MFYLCLSVCLFVCLSAGLLKSYERILMIFLELWGVAQETNIQIS